MVMVELGEGGLGTSIGGVRGDGGEMEWRLWSGTEELLRGFTGRSEGNFGGWY